MCYNKSIMISKENAFMSTHINAANKNDIASSVLLPGDPLRAKFIAENYLENVKCYSISL